MRERTGKRSGGDGRGLPLAEKTLSVGASCKIKRFFGGCGRDFPRIVEGISGSFSPGGECPVAVAMDAAADEQGCRHRVGSPAHGW